LPQGDYQISYENDGGSKVTRKLDLSLLSSADSIIVPETVLPKADLIAEQNVPTENINNTAITEVKVSLQTDTKNQDLTPETTSVRTLEPEAQAAVSKTDSSIVPGDIDRSAKPDARNGNKSVSETFHSSLITISVCLGLGILVLLFFLWRKRQNSKK
jgi:hypothetical protein